MKLHINRFLKYFNIQINRILPVDPEMEFRNHLNEDLQARQQLLTFYGINVLLDVGANTGQYSSLMRRIGYTGRIISFEPLTVAFTALKIRSDHDIDWNCENFALGDNEEQSKIHVSGNSYSSSILDILPSHIAYDADSNYVAEETIQIKRMDDIFKNYCQPEDVVMLKIDTQGFEKKVLEGAKQSLTHITVLQLEISIEPLYENETLFVEMIRYLEEMEFELFSLENGIRNLESGKLMQVDGIFVNKNKVR